MSREKELIEVFYWKVWSQAIHFALYEIKEYGIKALENVWEQDDLSEDGIRIFNEALNNDVNELARWMDTMWDGGYEKGASSVIDTVSNWLDEDTVDELRARFLREEEE